MSIRDITVTGFAPSMSVRRIREPVTSIFSTASAACSVSCALTAPVKPIDDAAPNAHANFTDLASLEFVNMYCLPGPLKLLVCVS